MLTAPYRTVHGCASSLLIPRATESCCVWAYPAVVGTILTIGRISVLQASIDHNIPFISFHFGSMVSYKIIDLTRMSARLAYSAVSNLGNQQIT